MTDPSVAVYQARADEWSATREPPDPDRPGGDLRRLAGMGPDASAPLVDLGCGPGWHTGALEPGAVALDAAGAMLDLVPRFAPEAHRVRGDLAALPFRRGSLAGALASKAHVHLPRGRVPLALADLHRALAPHAPARFVLFGGDAEHAEIPEDDFAGRRFSRWPRSLLEHVLIGAGFAIEEWTERPTRHGTPEHHVVARRMRTLPDTVAPGLRLLVCGLNPSLYAADAGVAFARPGNRFWPAALEADLLTRDRDPFDAVRRHGVGLTDLVKRATRAAHELSVDEYRAGLDRLRVLVGWLRPAVVCVVGLTGWRAAVDRHAVAGVQPDLLAGTPVYLMPNTSGLNAHHRLPDFVEHLHAAVALGGR